MKSKNSKKLQSFIQYCEAYPDQRFWQALRNWSKHDYIYFGDGVHDDPILTDTFYEE